LVVKVYPIIATPIEDLSDVRLHDKAFDDWNKAVQFLVEVFGARREDVEDCSDSYGHKIWKVETIDFKFQIHQLEVT
jgi:hypothetical protein